MPARISRCSDASLRQTRPYDVDVEPSIDLIEMLRQHRDAIIGQAASVVELAHFHHYQAEPSLVRSRLDRLFDSLITSIETRDLTSIVAHSDEMGRERFAAGFDLSEVQGAINGLEEAMWRHIVAELAPERYAEALGLVSTALGVAKDSLARTYVSLASQTHAPSLDMKRLFAGTEGA
jgi:hypothetical protein